MEILLTGIGCLVSVVQTTGSHKSDTRATVARMRVCMQQCVALVRQTTLQEINSYSEVLLLRSCNSITFSTRAGKTELTDTLVCLVLLHFLD